MIKLQVDLPEPLFIGKWPQPKKLLAQQENFQFCTALVLDDQTGLFLSPFLLNVLMHLLKKCL